jgi:hypothetical protein
MEDYKVHIDAIVFPLNENILKRQNLTPNEIYKIKTLYKEKLLLEQCIDITTSTSRMKAYSDIWFENEKRIQKALKFQDNDNFIKFWNLQHCTCKPEINEAKFPSGNYYINEYCLLHGNR